MWNALSKHFDKYPAQKKVALLLLKTGLSVRDNKIYCNEIEVAPSRIARIVGVDRRLVTQTVKTIIAKKELTQVYGNLQTMPFFGKVALNMNAGLIEVNVKDPGREGIVAKVTKIIAKNKISIRQCIPEDPLFSDEPKFYIITEKPLPLKVIAEIRKIRDITSILIH